MVSNFAPSNEVQIEPIWINWSWSGQAPQANFLQSSFSFIPTTDRVRSHFPGAKLQGVKYVGVKLQAVKYQNAKFSLFWRRINAHLKFSINNLVEKCLPVNASNFWKQQQCAGFPLKRPRHWEKSSSVTGCRNVAQWKKVPLLWRFRRTHIYSNGEVKMQFIRTLLALFR